MVRRTDVSTSGEWRHCDGVGVEDREVVAVASIWTRTESENIYQICFIPITLCPLYLGGTIPENNGMKQEARMTSISSSLVSNLLTTMFLPSYTFVKETWSLPVAYIAKTLNFYIALTLSRSILRGDFRKIRQTI